MEEKDIALVAKAIGDSTRLDIIKILRGQEKCVCKLLEVFDLKQPNLSYHLKILSDAGLIIGRQEGKWNHYRVNEERIGDFIESLKRL